MKTSNQSASNPAVNKLQERSQKKKLRQKLITMTHSRYGLVFLYFITFIESAFFPIPPDFLVVPMIVARPKSWKKLGIWVSFFSITGSFLGYFIGAVLFSTVGETIVDTYNLHDKMDQVGQIYQNNAFWSLLVAAFTPLPYKVFTIAAGVFAVPLVPFALASIIGRGARYMLVAYLAHIGGSKSFWTYLKKLKTSTWIAVAIIVTGVMLWFVLK